MSSTTLQATAISAALLRYNGASGAFIDVFADLGAMGLTRMPFR